MSSEAGADAAWRRPGPESAVRAGAVRRYGRCCAPQPEDFEVEERLGFEPDGGRAHLLLRVEKRAANTLFVARRLAARRGLCLRPKSALRGMKDRRALARQWFSLPARPAVPAAGFQGDGFTRARGASAFAQAAPRRAGGQSLPAAAAAGDRRRGGARGAAHGRGRERSAELLRPAALRTGGRQSRAGAATGWRAGACQRGREPRAFVLSTARALAFNAVLAGRVAAGSWNRAAARRGRQSRRQPVGVCHGSAGRGTASAAARRVICIRAGHCAARAACSRRARQQRRSRPVLGPLAPLPVDCWQAPDCAVSAVRCVCARRRSGTSQRAMRLELGLRTAARLLRDGVLRELAAT